MLVIWATGDDARASADAAIATVDVLPSVPVTPTEVRHLCHLGGLGIVRVNCPAAAGWNTYHFKDSCVGQWSFPVT